MTQDDAGSAPMLGSQRPTAWLVTEPKEFCPPQFLFSDEERAKKFSKIQEDLIVVPLYRSPTLTDEEREAIEKAAYAYAARSERGVGLEQDGPHDCAMIAATLRALLERLG